MKLYSDMLPLTHEWRLLLPEHVVTTCGEIAKAAAGSCPEIANCPEIAKSCRWLLPGHCSRALGCEE